MPTRYTLVRMLVGVVGVVPVDEEAAPDHGEEHGEVDPVHPADGEEMLLFEDERAVGWRVGWLRRVFIRRAVWIRVFRGVVFDAGEIGEGDSMFDGVVCLPLRDSLVRGFGGVALVVHGCAPLRLLRGDTVSESVPSFRTRSGDTVWNQLEALQPCCLVWGRMCKLNPPTPP